MLVMLRGLQNLQVQQVMEARNGEILLTES